MIGRLRYFYGEESELLQMYFYLCRLGYLERQENPYEIIGESLVEAIGENAICERRLLHSDLEGTFLKYIEICILIDNGHR